MGLLVPPMPMPSYYLPGAADAALGPLIEITTLGDRTRRYVKANGDEVTSSFGFSPPATDCVGCGAVHEPRATSCSYCRRPK